MAVDPPKLEMNANTFLVRSALSFLLVSAGCAGSQPPPVLPKPVPPPAPELSAPVLEEAVAVTGTGVPEAAVEILVDGTLAATGRVSEEGAFRLAVSALQVGQVVTAVQTVAGLKSALSKPVVVAPAVLTRLEIHPSEAVVMEQGTQRVFTVRGTFSNGRVEEPLDPVSWETEDASIVRINQQGMASGMAAGKVRVQARRGEQSAPPILVTVKPLPPALKEPLRVGVTEIQGTGIPGATVRILVNGVRTMGTVRVNPKGDWQSEHPVPLGGDDRVRSVQVVNGIESELSSEVKVAPNHPPILQTVGDHKVRLGETLALTLHASDPDGDTLMFSGAPLPPNSHLDSGAGTFTFAPTEDQVGSTAITFQVSDGRLSQAETVRVEVTLPHNLIVLLEDPDGGVGEISITNSQGTRILDEANQAMEVKSLKDPFGKTFVMEKEEVEKIFRDTLEAEPEAPLKFILYFQLGTTELSPESKQEIPKILSAIVQRTVPYIEVIGHTDRTASEAFNARLSLDRARIVYDLIVARGIDPQTIELSGHGENNPLIETPDGVAEPRNRRVEIMVR